MWVAWTYLFQVLKQHTWLLQKRFSNILEKPQIMEFLFTRWKGCSCFLCRCKLGKRPWHVKTHNWSTHYPILWSSHLQSIMALSKIKVEYCVLLEIARQIAWLWALLVESQARGDEPTMIQCDNQSALKLVKNPILHTRTKHIKWNIISFGKKLMMER
jgi:hypothetical protein